MTRTPAMGVMALRKLFADHDAKDDRREEKNDHRFATLDGHVQTLLLATAEQDKVLAVQSTDLQYIKQNLAQRAITDNAELGVKTERRKAWAKGLIAFLFGIIGYVVHYLIG